MEGGLRSRLTKGLGAQAFTQIVNVLIQIGTVPLLIVAWGVELYGEWLILTAIPVYLAMSDVGFPTAATNEMTMAVGRGDRPAALEAFQSVWLLVLVVSFAVVMAVGGAAWLLPLTGWLNLSVLTGASAGLILLLLSGQVLVSFQSGLIYAGFHCEGNYGLGQFLVTGVRILEFGLLAVTVILGGDPVMAAAALLTGRVVGTIGMRIALRRVNPWVTFGWRHAAFATVRRLAGPAVAFSAFPLGNALNLQGMVIVIGVVLGPTAVVVFATLRTMTRFGLALVRSVNVAIQAEIASAFGRDDADLLRKLHHRSCQAAFWLSGAVALGLALFGEWLLTIWTDGAVNMHPELFLLLLAVLVVNGLWLSSLMLVYATNRHQRVAVVYLTVNLMTVAAAYVLALQFGLVGVAAGLLVADAIMVVSVLPQSLGLLDDSVANFARVLVRPPVFVLKGLR
ncbi:MAG: lipopolysaccharide biosynthesis protein [Woeseia sp.]